MLLASLSLPVAAQVPIDAPGSGTSRSSSAPSVTTERQGGSFGLGLALGAPSGLTGSWWTGDWAALQFAAGGKLGVRNSLAASTDYVIFMRPFPGGEGYSVPLHIGAGFSAHALLEEQSQLQLGPRMVLGGTILVEDLPIDFHVQLAPTLILVDQTGWVVDGQIGLRYYY